MTRFVILSALLLSAHVATLLHAGRRQQWGWVAVVALLFPTLIAYWLLELFSPTPRPAPSSDRT